MRSFFDPIIVSTLPHLGALYFVYNCSGIKMVYPITIFISTMFSVAWHMHNEPKNWLFWFDYSFAFLWAFEDLLFAPNWKLVLLINGIAIATNHISDRLVPYEKAHSVWHLLNVSKSIYVAYLLSC
jgi:hypothetical protein